MNKFLHTSVGSCLTRRILMSAAFVVLALGASAQTTYTFSHYKGIYRDATVTNPKFSYVQQDASEDWNVIYSTAQTIALTRRVDAFHAYVRWFNYKTDAPMTGLTTVGSTGTVYNTDKGPIQLRADFSPGSNENTQFTANYVYDGSSVVYVGCDQSAYMDWSPNPTSATLSGTTFREPTLSQRIVYEIRPATEIAARVDTCTTNFLENYDLIAPVGRTIYLGPKYAYTSGSDAYVYPNYYFGATSPTQMLGSSSSSSTTTTYKIGNNTYTSEPRARDYSAGTTMTITKVVTTQGGGWQWTAGGAAANPTITSGQFAPFSSSAAGDVEYTLVYSNGGTTTTTTVSTSRVTSSGSSRKWTSNNDASTSTASSGSGSTYKIAKFTVHYKKLEEVGPYDISDANLKCLNGTKVLASQDFNFGATGLTTRDRYPYPLASDESTFGFFNSTTNHIGINDGNTTPSFTEYSFINDGTGWQTSGSGRVAGLANHTGNHTATSSTTGYALYADGSKKPGTVFAIKFNADLCPGAIMYFSAFVGEVSGNTHAILDFIVVGVDENGNETNLTTFTTGELSDCGTNWRHILFPLEFKSEVDFDHYRLRVINKANSTMGNDFFIDDIAVYLKPAPIQPIEASSANECLTDNSPLTLYTRYDYARANETASGTTDLYYRWLDYQGETIVTDLYYGANAGGTNGYIEIDQNYKDKGSKETSTSFAAFDAEFRTTDVPVARYIYETDLTELENGNKARYVLYIATPISVKLGDKYTCIIANDRDDLGVKNTCANTADITVSNGMRINSVAGGGMVKGLRKQICANYSYDLTVVMEYSVLEGNTTHPDRSAYVAHWLFGTAADVEADSTANGRDGLYGAGFTEIQKAVEAYKTDTITAAQTALINRLVQKGLLQLCKYDAAGEPVKSDTTYFVMPLNGETELSYTAFPVVKVKSNAPDCATPQSITLFFPTGDNIPDRNVVTFVKRYNETVPTFVNSRPRRVRIIEGTTEMQVKAELTNPSREYAFGAVSLHSTDDATYTSASAVPTITPKSPFTGDNLYVTFGGLGNLKAGHSYTFKVLYNLANPTADDIASACTDDKNAALRDGEAYITFLIVPKTLTYTGAGNNAAWNDDYNWSLVNGTDTTVTFVPLAETNVIFQSGDHIIADSITVDTSVEVKKRLQEAAVEKAALPYITYDINYQPYTCNNVYVPAATALPGQTNIDVKGTWTFEMPVTPNKWVMSAMPVQGIVSGDIFIPASGEESQEDYFAVKEMSQTSGNYAADRITYSFYNSMFNQSVINKDVNTTYDITSSTWSFATNALTTAFTAGFGWSLGFDNAAEGKSIRLPKKDTEYHYFRNDTWLGMSETITRDANYGKAAFNDDVELTLTQNADGKVFLLGNPTFAYIDLMALKNANSNITGVFYLSGLDNGSRYDHVTGQALADDWYTTDGQAPRYLAPMHAVLVVKNGDAAKELKIKITKSMLVTSNGSKDGAIITGAPRRAAALSAEKAIYIKAETGSFSSTALLLEDADASNAFFQDEDAEVFLLDQAKTPFAVYTVADSKALAINRISDLDVVPLGFYAQKNVSSEKIVFTGNDAYLSEWDLVDNSTGNREALSDGFTTTLSMSNNGVIRYYLEHARKTAPAGSDVTGGELTFSTYTQDGMLTVFAADDMIDFRLYDAAGRLLAADKNAGRQQDFCLPKGVYVVRANGKAAKVIVK